MKKVSHSFGIDLSRQRRYIFIASIILALILLVLAAIFSGSPLHVTTTNLAINLASSLFTVAITVTAIDYLIRSEFRFRTAPVYISGLRTIDGILRKLEIVIAQLCGYDIKQAKIEYDSKDVISRTLQIQKWYSARILEIQDTPKLDPKKIDKKMYKQFHKAVMGSYEEMDRFLNIYTYTMPDRLMEPIIKLRDDLDRAKRALEGTGDTAPEDLTAIMMFIWKLSVGIGELREAVGNNPTHEASQNYWKSRYGRRKFKKYSEKKDS